ncbi:MAG: hypothetical protein HY074_15105 [Deltaproteobacteria bacterium]|nr:hypothetical protein [Deltaproteobacteria bacterium]
MKILITQTKSLVAFVIESPFAVIYSFDYTQDFLNGIAIGGGGPMTPKHLWRGIPWSTFKRVKVNYPVNEPKLNLAADAVDVDQDIGRGQVAVNKVIVSPEFGLRAKAGRDFSQDLRFGARAKQLGKRHPGHPIELQAQAVAAKAKVQ